MGSLKSASNADRMASDGSERFRLNGASNGIGTCPAGIAVAVGLADEKLGLVGYSAVFRLVDAVVEQTGEEALLRLRARPPVHVRSAFTLSGDDVAHVVVGAARITIAGFAS